MSKWISVKDKLPDFRIPVLVADKQRRICVREYLGNLHWSQKKTDVTHWQSLPEPPKESRGD